MFYDAGLFYFGLNSAARLAARPAKSVSTPHQRPLFL